jgi:hypothetical protein
MRPTTIEVFVNEGYGHKKWIWTPNMSEEDFVDWWKNLSESTFIKYYFNMKTLPGTLREYKGIGVGSIPQREFGDPTSHSPYYYCLFNDVEDSYIAIGKDNHRFMNRGRYDWKTHWSDHSTRREKMKQRV